MESLKEHLAKQAYYFSYENEPEPTFLFHIRPEVIENLQNKFPLNEYARVGMLGEKAKGAEFEPSFEKGWGFHGSQSVYKGLVDHHTVLAFSFGRHFSFSNDPCGKCEGTGKDLFFKDRDCWDCKGTRKAKKRSAANAKTFRSIVLLIKYLWRFETEGTDFEKDIDMNDTIGGEVSQEFFELMLQFFEREKTGANFETGGIIPDYVSIPKALKAMSHYYHYVDRKEEDKKSIEWNRSDFEAYVNKHGCFFVKCPGINGCYLALEKHDKDHRGRRETTNHNVDNMDQEMSLIIGLAVLYQEVLLSTLSG